ncbi:MAG TPA: uracil-DNA glycosylase, partial [Thermoanaerobaculia bacterium]|nr:uracil-DNA glycosylase [Thermoanaerobaculia bacterium]
ALAPLGKAAAGAAPNELAESVEGPELLVAEAAGLTADSALFGPAPTGHEQFRTLDALGEFVRGCTRCRLAEGRKSVVFGSGNPHAELMFIGEGPGAEEDRQGQPFVGPAGELLTKIIGAIGLGRDDVYIANVVKCRPPGNRDPLPDESGACRGYLERQIDLVRPRVIVALGRVAAQTLLASELPLGRLRGRWHTVRGIPTRATYHPAALLRNASWKRPTWEDMQLVRDRLRDG